MEKRKRFVLILLLFLCLGFLMCSYIQDSINRKAIKNWLLRFPDERLASPPEIVPYKNFKEWNKAALKLKNPEKYLYEFYNDENFPRSNFYILQAFSTVGSEKCIPFLIQVAEDKTSDYRIDAISSLRSLGYKGFDISSAGEPLCRIVSDPNARAILKVNATAALGEIGNKSSIPIIEQALKDLEYDKFYRKCIISDLQRLKENSK
jgi:hypothetical protein